MQCDIVISWFEGPFNTSDFKKSDVQLLIKNTHYCIYELSMHMGRDICCTNAHTNVEGEELLLRFEMFFFSFFEIFFQKLRSAISYLLRLYILQSYSIRFEIIAVFVFYIFIHAIHSKKLENYYLRQWAFQYYYLDDPIYSTWQTFSEHVSHME